MAFGCAAHSFSFPESLRPYHKKTKMEHIKYVQKFLRKYRQQQRRRKP